MIIDRGRVVAALPGYTLGEQLGAGAFGLVLAGEHRRMGRAVAVKVMPAEGPEGVVVDFAAEVRVLANLDHPHVVRAYDYVEAEGLCLVVMELLSGGTLTRQRDGMPPERACAVGLAVAAAVHHAHGRGVLHRDIKSDNILFAADGTVKVTDFGIAKMFEGSAATASGVAGTPMYMAPEQIEGGRLGPATDLYALGVVLYRLLTGGPPFDPRLPVNLLWRQHVTAPPPPMAGVSAPVADVVLRALAKDPADRQADVRAFAVDLAAAASQTFGPGWTGRGDVPLYLDDDVRRATEPPPAPHAAYSVALLPAPAPVRHGDAPAPARHGDAVEGDAVEGGSAEIRAGTPEPSVAGMSSGPSGDPAATAATAATVSHAATASTVSHAATVVLPPTRPTATDGAETGAGTPGGLAPARSTSWWRGLARRSRRRRAVLASAVVLVLVLTAASLSLFRPGGLLTRGPETDLDMVSRRLAAEASAVADDQPELARRLAVAAYRTAPTPKARVGVLRLLASGDQPLATLTGHTEYISGVAFSPDGRLLASRSGDNIAWLWDTTRRGEVDQPLATFTGHTDWVRDVEFSPDGGLLATGSWDDTARLWDTTRRGEVKQPLTTFTGHTGDVLGVVFSPDGGLLATSGGDGTVRLWDTTRRGEVDQPLATFTGHSGVTGVVFSPDGSLLATGGSDKTARLWDTTRRGEVDQPLATLTGHTEYISSVVFSPDGSLLATGGSDKTARLWDTTRRGEVDQSLATLTGHTDAVRGVVFSPDGSRLATGGSDKTARLWDTTRRGEVDQPLATLTGHTEYISSVVFSPDGGLVATSDHNGVARLWDTTLRGDVDESLATLTGHTAHVYGAVFSSDGGLLATSSDDGTARLWDTDADRLAENACADPAGSLTAGEWEAVLPDVPYDPPCA